MGLDTEPPSPQEERLLEFGRRASTRTTKRRSLSLQGPLRALRLCLLCVLIPGLLIAVPLYLRYHVYYKQEYALSMSDMRMINAHVSTTWCQKQEVRVNATFNAYVVDGTPGVLNEPTRVSMDRHLVLSDDMKEYWAFYLLKGSVVTVSTCVRWQGASLIVIKGHKHLRECAYIGDNSSEEEDEVAEEAALHQDSADAEDANNNTNTPQRMRRLRPGVVLHGSQPPISSKEKLKKGSLDTSEDEDNILARVLLRKAKVQLQPNQNVAGTAVSKTNPPEVPSKVDKVLDEKRVPTSQEIFDDLLMKMKLLGPRGKTVLTKLYEQLEAEGNTELQMKIKPLLSKDDGEEKTSDVEDVKTEATTSQDVDVNDDDGSDDDESEITTMSTSTDLKDVNDAAAKTDVKESSSIVLKDVKVGVIPQEVKVDDDEDDAVVIDDNGESEHGKVTTQTPRKRRQITLGSAQLHELLNKHDIAEDTAIEEDLAPDGIADHHRTLNETTAGDHSHSEYWSSFSSSEEALLQCAGLVLNLPLTPHRDCEKHRTSDDHARASLANTVTYKVANTGYYFFVFSSENEVQENYFSVHFHLEKMMYDVSKPVHSCKNATESCTLPLTFWSSDTVVLELPVGRNDSAWNEDFVAESTCEPRTAVFLVCVISVPLVIVSFAFH